MNKVFAALALLGTLIIAGAHPSPASAQTITCYRYQNNCIRDLLRLTASGQCGWVIQGPTIWRVACPD